MDFTNAIPNFSNFSAAKALANAQSSTSTPSRLKNASLNDINADFGPTKRSEDSKKDKKNQRRDERFPSSRQKHKKKHKFHSYPDDFSDASIESNEYLEWNESRKADELSKFDAANDSRLFEISQRGHRKLLEKGIHSLDRPDFERSTLTVLGGNSKKSYIFSSDYKTFEAKKSRQSINDHTQMRSRNDNVSKRYYQDTLGPAKSEDKTKQKSLDFESTSNWEIQYSERTRQINDLISVHPSNPLLWRQLLDLQNDFRKELSCTKAGLRFLIEKKLEITTKALEHVKGDYFLTCMQLKYYEVLNGAQETYWKWNEIISDNSSDPRLWFAYLQFVRNHFSISSLFKWRTAYQASIRHLVRSLADHPVGSTYHFQIELHIVKIIILASKVEYENNHTARAIAIFQALIEANFFPPVSITAAFIDANSMSTTSLSLKKGKLTAARDSLISYFRLFWESGLPRFGEEGARGWSHYCSLNPALLPSSEIYDPLNTYSQHIHIDTLENDEEGSIEQLQDENVMEIDTSLSYPIFPKRIPEMTNFNMDSVIIFEDLQSILILFSYDELRRMLIFGLLGLLGVDMESFHDDSYDNEHVNDIILDELPHSTKFHFGVKPEISSTKNRVQCMSKSSYPAHLYLSVIPLLFMVSSIDLGIVSTPDAELASFCRRAIMNGAAVIPDLFIAFAGTQFILDGKSAAKDHLQQNPQSFELWDEYACLEIRSLAEMASATSAASNHTLKQFYRKIKEIRRILKASVLQARQHCHEDASLLHSLLRLVRTWIVLEFSLGQFNRIATIATCIFNVNDDYERRLSFEEGVDHLVDKKSVLHDLEALIPNSQVLFNGIMRTHPSHFRYGKLHPIIRTAINAAECSAILAAISSKPAFPQHVSPTKQLIDTINEMKVEKLLQSPMHHPLQCTLAWSTKHLECFAIFTSAVVQYQKNPQLLPNHVVLACNTMLSKYMDV